ncbi:MAG: SprT-like domain-containing protein [Verrucomicrobiaceae bacterium]|nr:SprT-like domain-containing protein [Verrucomicrobiaceae bacterium]
MRIQPTIDELTQATFSFLENVPVNEASEATEVPCEEDEGPVEELTDSGDEPPGGEEPLVRGPDMGLEDQARQMLLDLGMEEAVPYVKVLWNPRLKSTAGYAAYPSWRIELNPRLLGFEGQVDRTLKHELAHLVAYHRAGRRRIEPHGPEWQKACADLGIPGEPAHHRLPLPRSRRERNLAYQCPHCLVVVKRVRIFKRPTACLACCRAHNGGHYHERFRFFRVALSDPAAQS